MVVIRLTRGGAKKRPFYHIVVAHKQNRRDGQFIERLGYFNPIAASNEVGLTLAAERIDFWKQQGAALSPTVARLVKQHAAQQPAAA
jgi:small subunit ribosomal protein S16